MTTTTTATKTASITANPVIFGDGTRGTRYEVWEHRQWTRVGVGYDKASAVSMAIEKGYSITAAPRS